MNSESNLKKTILLNDVKNYSLQELSELAERIDINIENTPPKELMYFIISNAIKNGYKVNVNGVLEVIKEKYGFLRYESDSYCAGNSDVFVSEGIVRQLSLKTGDSMFGQIKISESSNSYAIDSSGIKTINDLEPKKNKLRQSFDYLTAIHPKRRIVFGSNIEMKVVKNGLRLIDLVTPMGFGQRALIVAPPKTGKTTLMKSMAHSIIKNYPGAHVMIVLIGERPEEVTDMKRSVKDAIVVSSTFDEPPSKHIAVADIALERAKRLVECKKDVVILLDSLTRFARSNNSTVPPSGRVLTGGLDINALQKPKQFFGAARELDEGGSLTIIATILIDTGSKAEDVIYEEFQGTSNSVVFLNRSIAEARKFPAIEISRSGTRKEELLMSEPELNMVNLMRISLSSMTPVESLTRILRKVELSEDNEKLIRTPL